MSPPLKILLATVLLTVGAGPVWSQMVAPAPPPGPPPALAPVAVVPPPLPPGVTPAWTAVPTAPRVFYAPNLGVDLFRLQKRYYYYSGGTWYRGNHLRGPWRPVRQVPRAIYRVKRTYFRSPPPW